MTGQPTAYDPCAEREPRSVDWPWPVGLRRTHRTCIKRVQHVRTSVQVSPERVAEFRALTKQWKRETAIAGNLSKIVMHPAYQRIMAMGKDAIPLILKDLSKEQGHWFWALHNLVPPGDDPAAGTTTIRDATRAWLEWGKARHIL